MWRQIRILLLLLVLLAVAVGAWLDRAAARDWDDTLSIGVYPLNADGSATAERYIRQLEDQSFTEIENFFTRETRRFGIRVDRPVQVELFPPVKRLPAFLPDNAGPLDTAWWSLKLRWYARQMSDVPGRVRPQIRVFVLYHDPEITARVRHSLGLEKGLIGVVHAFADESMNGGNNIVIVHEVMHTLGARDKYDPRTNVPVFPHGFADPRAEPLYPQMQAEIMAGRRPLSARALQIPDDLDGVIVGPATAAEIGWGRR